jgi:hypothetical protein
MARRKTEVLFKEAVLPSKVVLNADQLTIRGKLVPKGTEVEISRWSYSTCHCPNCGYIVEYPNGDILKISAYLCSVVEN